MRNSSWRGMSRQYQVGMVSLFSLVGLTLVMSAGVGLSQERALPQLPRLPQDREISDRGTGARSLPSLPVGATLGDSRTPGGGLQSGGDRTSGNSLGGPRPSGQGGDGAAATLLPPAGVNAYSAGGGTSLQWVQPGRIRLAPCLVKVIEKIELPAREAGVLEQLAVTEGQWVEAGTPIAVVDDQAARTELESAQRRLEASQLKINSDINIRYGRAAQETALKAYQREKALVARGAGTPAKMDELELAYTQAQLQLEKAEHDFQVDQKAVLLDQLNVTKARQLLERHTLVAPWDGVVTRVLTRQNEWLNAGDPILEMVQMGRLWVEADIDPLQLSPHQVAGRPVQVTLVIPGGERVTFDGQVNFVDSEVVANRYKVRAEVPNRQVESHWLLVPGTFVDMEIIVQTPGEIERLSRQ